MRRVLSVMVALTTAAAVISAIPAATATPAAQPAESYIIVLESGASPGTVAREHDRRYGAEVSHLYRNALKGYSARMTPAAASRVAADPRVDFVQVDGAVSATAQETPTGIRRVNGDLSSARSGDGTGSTSVDVAIIDTGIDLDHPDLNVYAAGAKNCSTGRSADDGNGHGSHVAGTVGAKDDANGVVGVVPGARVWPVRVLNNQGSGSFSSIVCGIDFVAANASQIEVANMSLGGSGSDDGNCGNSNNDAMHKAICNAVAKGVTFVVAAGNSGADSAGYVPAAYDEVITVSALADFNGEPGGLAAPTCRSDVDDTLADFSNFGADVDLIAPGVCIQSTWKGGGYHTISGTSMASPHVAGGAALYLSTHPGTSPSSVKSALQTAGSTDWSSVDDPDGIKEKLLDVGTF